MKNKIKDAVKIIIFLGILFLIYSYVFKIIWLEKNSFSYLYDEPRNSIDIAYVGSSNAYTSFNTVLAYNMYGFKTSLISFDAQPFDYIKYLIKETEKYQKPKLYIIDIAKLPDKIDSYTDIDIRRRY